MAKKAAKRGRPATGRKTQVGIAWENEDLEVYRHLAEKSGMSLGLWVRRAVKKAFDAKLTDGQSE